MKLRLEELYMAKSLTNCQVVHGGRHAICRPSECLQQAYHIAEQCG